MAAHLGGSFGRRWVFVYTVEGTLRDGMPAVPKTIAEKERKAAYIAPGPSDYTGTTKFQMIAISVDSVKACASLQVTFRPAYLPHVLKVSHVIMNSTFIA